MQLYVRFAAKRLRVHVPFDVNDMHGVVIDGATVRSSKR